MAAAKELLATATGAPADLNRFAFWKCWMQGSKDHINTRIVIWCVVFGVEYMVDGI